MLYCRVKSNTKSFQNSFIVKQKYHL